MFIVEKNILVTILASFKMENKTQNTNKKSQETLKIMSSLYQDWNFSCDCFCMVGCSTYWAEENGLLSRLIEF